MHGTDEDDQHPADSSSAGLSFRGGGGAGEGETLSQFVEAPVRASVERRRLQAEFIARGLRSRDEARRTGHYVDADLVIDGLQRKLDAARTRLAKQGG